MDTPPLPRRKTIRLQNYDYSQSGAYFVTICTAQRQPLFGKIIPPATNAVGAAIKILFIPQNKQNLKRT